MGSDLPPVSVVMPSYNAASFVRQAVSSILRQTHPEFELIVVDDGSEDGTLSILEDMAREDSRIVVIPQTNAGISHALNRGIEEAQHDWIAIMHSDDVAMPHRLERQLKAAIGNPEVIAWGSYAVFIGERGKRLGLSQIGPTSLDQYYRFRKEGKPFWLVHTSVLMQKNAVVRVGGYDPFFTIAEDLDLFTRLANFGPILAIDEPLVLYRVHGSSNSIKRFRENLMFTRYIIARERSRALGKPPAVWSQFCEEMSNVPVAKKTVTAVADRGQYWYRRFACEVAAGNRVRALAYLLASVALAPRFVLRRVWRQRVSSSARDVVVGRSDSAEESWPLV